MAQVTWRGSDELVERVRRAAREHGRSMNDYVTAVLDAATDPNLAGSDAARFRERISQAGLLAKAGTPRTRPPASRLANARAAASEGTPLGRLVVDDR